MLKITRLLLVIFLFSFSQKTFGYKISGVVTDEDGKNLPNATIIIKETGRATIANKNGFYAIEVPTGEVSISCHYIGFAPQTKKIVIESADQTVNFQMAIQHLSLANVVVKSGDNPANAIMKKAINKRNFYDNQVEKFSAEVYIKAMIRSKKIPKFFRKKKEDRSEMEKMGLDSLGNGIVFLLESLTDVYFKQPNKYYYQVKAARTSGSEPAFAFPYFINMYENNVKIFSKSFNVRGFVSPLSDFAFNFYRFKLEGTFFENNKMINHIKVTPKRKNEPLFKGYINIAEDDWYIHSLDLLVSKDYSLEILDTLSINQVYYTLNNNVERIKTQVLKFSFKALGLEAEGNFLNCYNNYNLEPDYPENCFGNVLIKVDTAYTKKDTAFWERNRIVALEKDEVKNFHFRDSVTKRQKILEQSKPYLDSVRKEKTTFVLSNLWRGYNPAFKTKNAEWNFRIPILYGIDYNTVEGLNFQFYPSASIVPFKSKVGYAFGLNARYGFANKHFNIFSAISIFGKQDSSKPFALTLVGGKRVNQFNNENPVNTTLNSLYTLLLKENYLKLYESYFGKIGYKINFQNGLKLSAEALFEQRLPLENTTDFSYAKNSTKQFSPNHPPELSHIPFEKHNAFDFTLAVSYQPGMKYLVIENRRRALGSKYPEFSFAYNKGVPNIFNSVSNFDKWSFEVKDDFPLHLRGELKYRITIGGFLNKKLVNIPDMIHFNGNQTIFAANYLSGFQIAPYYQYSNTANFYSKLNAEWHLSGFISNKIPLFNKLKWHIVAGTNSFYVNPKNYYIEGFVAVENIFKILRVDFIKAWQANGNNQFGIRVGAGGILSRNVTVENSSKKYN